MFEFNGYVYGGNPKEPIRIENIKPLDDMMMLVLFSNGEERLFDATVLTSPVFEPLRNESIFKNPEVDHGIVTWNNGEIDCAPEYVYEHSYEYARKIS